MSAQQLALFDDETTDSDIRSWAAAQGLECPPVGPLPDSLREAHDDPTMDVGPFVCPWCGQEERSRFALDNNHWTPRNADLCIAMDLTRNHVVYFAQVLSGEHAPHGCVSSTCRHRVLSKDCAREQLDQAIQIARRVWPSDRWAWLEDIEAVRHG